MTTHTHTGTCQACGRRHAVNVKSGKLAKHGYTVDWGFFNGTCAGSGHLPLEQDTELNLYIINDLRVQAAKLDIDAEGPIEKVRVRDGGKYVGRNYVAQYKLVDRAEFEATQPHYAKFDREVELVRVGLRRQAELFRQHADYLDNLRETTFGRPLVARVVEEPIQREHFNSYREAYARVAELKKLGHKAQSRRQGWSQTYTVTYR